MEYNLMSDDDIRNEIAVRNGFSKVRRYHDKWTGEHDTAEWGPTRDRIPDWPHDMNAAYALEGEITERNEREAYGMSLYNVVALEERDTFDVTRWAILHATPRQRCIAWLMWDDGRVK